MAPCLTILKTERAMESPQKTQAKNNNGEAEISFDDYCQQLPKDTSFRLELVHHQGFWCPTRFLRPVLSFQAHFEAQSTDIFITGMPKTGNTWLKSLVFATIHRHHQPISDSPLLRHNSNDLIPLLELGPYLDDPLPDLGQTLMYQGPTRVFSSHLPYETLPRSIHDLGCRIIYICRNPSDALVSSWFFFGKVLKKMISPGNSTPSMEEYFELYLQGLTPFGPFFEHVLGYWKMSIEMPDRILFLNYEELLQHTPSQLKRIAKFIEHPFSEEEEQGGVIREIIKLCSIKNLKELTVNKEGQKRFVDNHAFFRKGEMGDWVNYLTPSMVDRMRKLMLQKFDGFDLSIKDIML